MRIAVLSDIHGDLPALETVSHARDLDAEFTGTAFLLTAIVNSGIMGEWQAAFTARPW